MLSPRYGNHFKKDLKTVLQRQGHSLDKLKKALDYLVAEKPLPPEYNDHNLKGKYKGCREFHLLPDWIVIYRVKSDELIVVRTGSHSDLF